MSADIITLRPDRPTRRGFISLGAAVSAVIAGIPKAGADPDPVRSAVGARDPILALIAEEDRVRTLAVAERERAEGAATASGMGWNDEEAGPLFAETDRLEGAAGDLYDQVASTKATTIEGVIAQIWFLWPGAELNDDVDVVIAGLRDIAAGGAA